MTADRHQQKAGDSAGKATSEPQRDKPHLLLCPSPCLGHELKGRNEHIGRLHKAVRPSSFASGYKDGIAGKVFATQARRPEFSPQKSYNSWAW